MWTQGRRPVSACTREISAMVWVMRARQLGVPGVAYSPELPRAI